MTDAADDFARMRTNLYTAVVSDALDSLGSPEPPRRSGDSSDGRHGRPTDRQGGDRAGSVCRHSS